MSLTDIHVEALNCGKERAVHEFVAKFYGFVDFLVEISARPDFGTGWSCAQKQG